MALLYSNNDMYAQWFVDRILPEQMHLGGILTKVCAGHDLVVSQRPSHWTSTRRNIEVD